MSDATARDVIEARRLWSVDQGDALAWLGGLPDDSISLLFCSPPYERARTYLENGEDLAIARDTEAWVAWLVEVVRAAAPKVTGLIALVVEGQTKGYRYSCGPDLLRADLHRAGFNLRKSPIYRRVGIPGSGGPDWLRNDYEPIVCVTRPGRLPWSEPTACGHPPKWKPGGEVSYRDVFGVRVTKKKTQTRSVTHGGKGDTQDVIRTVVLPAIANPGNVAQRTYTAREVAAIVGEPTDVRDCLVAGGQLGHPLAHENEAPFTLELASFFVKTFCPPGGVTADCFAGSSTTGHACLDHGRRYVGCDLRRSQVELSRRRLGSVTPSVL
jgi:hypothetical protein